MPSLAFGLVATIPIRVDLLSSAEAEERMGSAAAGLLGLGLGRGDRVAFWLSSSADLLCAVLGAARVGIIPVLLNANLLLHERDDLIVDCGPAHVVLDEHSLADLFVEDRAPMSPYPLTRPMHYTSGTTGRAKGVTTGVWDEETAQAVHDDEVAAWNIVADDTHMVCSPMYHTVAIRLSAATLLTGGSLAILTRFDAPTALDVLRTVRPTTAFLVPTHLHRLLALPDLGDDEVFDSLRLLMHAGAPCPPVLKRQAIERVPPGALWEFYGATEGQFTTCSTEDWRARPGTVGRARSGRTLFIEPLEDHEETSDAGSVAQDPEVGTIWCRVPPFGNFEYFANPAATALAWRGDAFSVGDIGWLDDDGYLYLTGRRSDLIISGGVNVYPAEVEAALCDLDDVDEACVFGLDDSEWGQKVCAAIVGAPGATAEGIMSQAREVLAPFKRPKAVFLTASLPIGPTGKVLRRQIVEHLGLA
ncbi:MAG: AMP-binding protein [Actinomycetes bacterium]